MKYVINEDERRVRITTDDGKLTGFAASFDTIQNSHLCDLRGTEGMGFREWIEAYSIARDELIERGLIREFPAD